MTVPAGRGVPARTVQAESSRASAADLDCLLGIEGTLQAEAPPPQRFPRTLRSGRGTTIRTRQLSGSNLNLMHTTTLNTGWQFRPAYRGPGYGQPNVSYLDWMSAEVPGHVHLDLARHGIIPDPFKRRFEFGAQWVDREPWSYRTAFEWSPKAGSPKRILRFEGLDTNCTIWLNGAQIAESDNMFVPLEVDVTDRLEKGQNELRIEFASAVVEGDKRRTAYFAKEGLDHKIDFFDERAFVRKAGYMFAWDWGPRLVSCGIWKPVLLLEFASRIKSVHWRQESTWPGGFLVTPTAEVEGEGEVTFVLDGITRKAGESFDLKPELWWPNGYGGQRLYPAAANLSNGEIIEKQLGFRTIKLDRTLDTQGESFQFVVNGRPIFARGANWIPNDSFPSRITVGEYENQVARCKALKMNMLRVWGGGLYEGEAFYDACDKHGLLVWQDFPFACSYYPDDEAMQASIRLEAECNITRLRDRPSLAIWCGNNENLTMWEGKWGSTHPPRYYGEPLYEETLPAAVNALDPDRAYIATSPIGGSHANADDFGDQHYWDVWHGKGDWKFYADSGARFCSEFGFASGCSPHLWHETLEDFTLAEGEHLSHDKTNKPWPLFKSYVELHYPEPKTLDEWSYYSQLNQRDAMRFGIEHYRRSPGCAGALVWQFNDCWPVQSWALQDYGRELKVAGWEMARLCAPVLLSVVLTEDEAEIWLINDTLAAGEFTVQVKLVSTDLGSVISSSLKSTSAGPGERAKVGTVSTKNMDTDVLALWVRVEGTPDTARWCLFGEPKNTKFSPAEIEDRGAGAFFVKGFVRDLVAWQGDEWLVSSSHGSTAVTACDEEIRYELRSDAVIRFTSLAGEHRAHVA